jgi:hypothetical protein
MGIKQKEAVMGIGRKRLGRVVLTALTAPL